MNMKKVSKHEALYSREDLNIKHDVGSHHNFMKLHTMLLKPQRNIPCLNVNNSLLHEKTRLSLTKYATFVSYILFTSLGTCSVMSLLSLGYYTMDFQLRALK